MRLLLVCLGGALGSGARYLVALAIARPAGASFPWATFTVNAVGCFLLEVLVAAAASGLRLSDELRLLLATGVLGGFTTYSSFNTETIGLARRGDPALALLYMGVTITGCLLAGLAGAAAGRAVFGAAAAP